MCGIIGALSERDIVPILLDGLRQLEYRGYDSAGLAVILPDAPRLRRVRTRGKVARLAAMLEKEPLEGTIGHSPHTLGNPWRALGAQRPPACLGRTSGHSAQRHHREL